MTTDDDKTMPIVGEDEVEAAVKAADRLLDHMGKLDPDDPNRTTFALDEDGQVVHISGPQT